MVEDADSAIDSYSSEWYDSYEEWQDNADQDSYSSNLTEFLNDLAGQPEATETAGNVDGQEYVNGVNDVSEEDWQNAERDAGKWADRFLRASQRGDM
jgi:hypothetical protein